MSDQGSAFRFLPAVRLTRNSQRSSQGRGDQVQTVETRGMLATAPGLRFTWSAKPPDNIKLRKALVVYPLKVRLGVDFNVRTKQLSYHAMCKETILGGTIGLNTDCQEIVYRKEIPLAAPGLSTTFSLAAEARASYQPLLDRQARDFRPRLMLGIHSGSNNFSMVRNSFDVRQKVRVTDHFQAEVCANLAIPLPDSEFRWEATGDASALSVGRGDVHLHVSQLNAIFKL